MCTKETPLRMCFCPRASRPTFDTSQTKWQKPTTWTAAAPLFGRLENVHLARADVRPAPSARHAFPTQNLSNQKKWFADLLVCSRLGPANAPIHTLMACWAASLAMIKPSLKGGQERDSEAEQRYNWRLLLSTLLPDPSGPSDRFRGFGDCQHSTGDLTEDSKRSRRFRREAHRRGSTAATDLSERRPTHRRRAALLSPRRCHSLKQIYGKHPRKHPHNGLLSYWRLAHTTQIA